MTLLAGGRLADGTPADVRVDAALATVVEVGPSLLAAAGEELVDCTGLVVLDAPVEPHAHLDKAGTIERWNQGELPVALIHPASAGHGLNLQAGGSALIWFGLTWSLELYQQTNARLWRQGQQSETVVIHHIITKDTIDEMVMKALDQKNLTQSALMDAVRAQLRR